MEENERLKPYKKDFEYSYTLGVFPSLELIENNPSVIRKVILSSKGEKNQGVSKILDFTKKSGIPALFDDKTLCRISSKDNCFAAAVFEKYECSLQPERSHLVLVNPADMGNLGTILRSSTAFGIEDVAIIAPAADIFDPKVIRASMGAMFHVNFKYYSGFDEYLKDAGFSHFCVPFMLDGKPMSEALPLIEEKSREYPLSLIFGNESAGLPAEFAEIGQPVFIEHGKTVDSLNLPTAVGIGLYIYSTMKGRK